MNNTSVVIPISSFSELIKLLSLEHVLNSNIPLDRILKIVMMHKCKSVIVEENHKHRGYSEEYVEFYSTTFKKHSPLTTRIHFFSANAKDIDPKNLKNNENHYLGFCVLRPVDSPKVVEAIIRPPIFEGHSNNSFFICKNEYSVQINIKGSKKQLLKIRAFPFIQPDGRVGTCAHGAIATIDHYLCNNEKISDRKNKRINYFIAKIHKLAVRDDVKFFPRIGLSPEEIQRVLRAMGYHAQVYNRLDDKPYPRDRLALWRIIHYYIESGIPVILGLPTATMGHAMTIIGHSSDPHCW